MATDDKFAGEMLTDDELDNVTGGTCYDAGGDSRFLNDLAGLCDQFSDETAFSDPQTVKDAVRAAWKQIGISVFLYPTMPINAEYSINNRPITRQQAFAYACKQYGKNLQDMPGDYNL